MKIKKASKLISLLLCALLFWPSPVFAKVQIVDLVATNDDSNLLIDLKVEGAFKEKMEEAILNGIPTTFSYFIVLQKPRFLRPSKNIEKIKVTHTIKYNNLKNNYAVKRSWDGNKTLTTDSFDEAKRLMSEISGLKVIPLKKLKKGRQYTLKAKAELDRVTLPFFLNYVFFFVSLWDFETDWYTVKYVYE